MLSKIKYSKWLLLSFVFIFGFIYFLTYFPYANDGPRGIHQWAQADRMALCMRFIEGNSLSEPATLSWRTENGNTGVEFSGYQYVIAQIIRAGVDQKYLPIIYRLTTFCCLFISLFTLVYSVIKHENWFFKGFTFLGLLSSPILLYYGYNFLPDIIGLSLIVACLYLFNKDFERYFYIILLISGLSLLIKTSSGIYFISFMAIYFLKYWNKWNLKLILGGLLFISIGSAVAYYDITVVNGRNIKYNSEMFLSQTLPTKSWKEFVQIFDTASRFKSDYFNGAQRLLILMLDIVGIANIKKVRIKNKNTQLGILVGLGLLSIILLFGVQYMNHDYYVIGTFMPITLYFIIKGIARISEYIHPRTGLVLVGIFAFTSFSLGNQKYFNRMSEHVWINNYREVYYHKWLKEAEEKIDDIIPKDALVFSVYSPEHNFALVHLNRKGICFNAEEMGRQEGNPFHWLMKYHKAEYVICYSRFIESFKKDQPEFVANAIVLYSDEQFSVYKKNGH